MRDFLRKWRIDVLLSAALCLALGVIIMIWPDTATIVLARMIGAVLVIRGAAHCLDYFRNRDRAPGRLGLASGAVLFALGALLLIRPPVMAQLMAFLIGAILLMHGLEDVKFGLESKGFGDENWWTCILASAVTIALGIVIIWQYFKVASIATWLMGGALVFDGLSDIFVVIKVVRAMKSADIEEREA